MAVVPRGVRCVSGCGYAKRVRAFCKTVCILTVSGVGCTPFFCFLFPYLSVPLRFRTRSLHTHSKHLYAHIPLPDGCRNYKLRHSACTLCFKACGFVKIHSLLTGAPALFRAARQKIKHPLPLRKRVFFVLIRCFCHFAVYRSFYRSYFVMHFYAAVSVHLYFSSFIFINILLFYPAPFLPYCCRLTVYRTSKAEKLQARQEYRKARP